MCLLAQNDIDAVKSSITEESGTAKTSAAV